MKDTENKVELLGTYGSDETHALSAWTSTSRDLTDDKLDRIPKLLEYLATNKHHTPFEKSSQHFLITTDIATHIHFLKHRIGVAINGECLAGDTMITFIDINNTSSPKLKKSIEYLYNQWNKGRPHQNTGKDKEYVRTRTRNRRVRVLNEDTGFFEYSHIKDIYKSGEKQIYKITLADGKEIRCSENHRILTKDGWGTLADRTLNKTKLVAINGITTHDESRPWTFPEFFKGSETLTRRGFAESKGLKLGVCKKWGYFFNIVFKVAETKGKTPWNKGVAGHTLVISKEGLKGRSDAVKRGKDSHFWRGGISKERALIGTWATTRARKVHEKYNFTCQNCGESSKDLKAHHTIPVTQDKSKAYDFNNLITVCGECHKSIHKSLESEQAFAEKVLDIDFTPFLYGKRVKSENSRKLHVHYSKIVSIEEDGFEDTYDIEIEGKWKNFVSNGMVVHNSARYKEMRDDKFYLPTDWPAGEQDKLKEHIEDCMLKYHETLDRLVEKGIDRKRAKESARFYLPYGIQVTYDVMFNFRSFMHFLGLRLDEHAQLEVREVAQKMLDLVRETGHFDESLKSFGW